jgi:proline iminopeptidase
VPHGIRYLPLWISCAFTVFSRIGTRVEPTQSSPKPDETRSDSGYTVLPDGARLFYRTLGRGGDTVVMLHGGPGSDMESSLADVAPLALGRTLLFYDQRGGGRSGPVANIAALTAEQHVRDLEALRQYFHLERMILFGHSWGAGLAVLYALEHPKRVHRMVLVGSMWPRHSPYADQYQATLRARLGPLDYARFEVLADSFERADDPIRVCREFGRLFLRAAGSTEAGLKRVRGDVCAAPPQVTRTLILRSRVTLASLGDYDWRPLLAALDVPTLVVHGARDVVPESASREWASALSGARLLVIPGAGHLPYADKPVFFYSRVSEFLGGAWPKEARRVASPTKRLKLTGALR